MFFSLLYCPVPKSHLVSLSWWVDAKVPEQRFGAEREALSVLAAEHCEASIYAEHWGYWQVATELALPSDHNSGSFGFPEGNASL